MLNIVKINILMMTIDVLNIVITVSGVCYAVRAHFYNAKTVLFEDPLFSCRNLFHQ